MAEHSGDAGVFIRSLAARGHLGGLTRTASRIVDVMDAAGLEVILIETVGAGQSEVEVADVAAIKIVVSAPGLGDEVQAIKAGILEIADILVVNKFDLPMAPATLKALKSMLHLRAADAAPVAVIATVATTGEGLGDLVDAVFAHDQALRQSGGVIDPRPRIRRNLSQAVGQAARDRFGALDEDQLGDIIDSLRRGEVDYATAAQSMLDHNLSRK
jgi:LAO/AO transport system kinase